jgi:hypothetical protein
MNGNWTDWLRGRYRLHLWLLHRIESRGVASWRSLKTGLQYPEVKTACELGFGQGMSTNLHAAASRSSGTAPTSMPAQAAFTPRTLAAVAGANGAQL